jgi:hypothetical protein
MPQRGPMYDRSMSNREAIARVRPREGTDRNQILIILAFLGIGIAGAAGLRTLLHHSHVYRQQHWYSSEATVKDVQPKLLQIVDSRYGGYTLYQAEVLASFSIGGVPQQRWIGVQQQPRTKEVIEAEGRFWRGKQYVVRWNPANPNQMIVELPIPF